jgi:hypothetical protein
MTIDFTTVLKDQDDKPIPDVMAMQLTDTSPFIELTLGRACFNALLTQKQNETELNGQDKFHRGELAFNIRNNTSYDLNQLDKDLIKTQLGYLYSPIVIYRAYRLLDGE